MDRRVLFAALLIGTQAILPLRYYLGLANDYDERFAWRMFSPERMLRCGAKFQVGGEDVELKRTVHSAWVTLVGRGRASVTEAVGRRLCLTNPGQEVTLRYECQPLDADRVVLSRPDHDICPDGVW